MTHFAKSGDFDVTVESHDRECPICGCTKATSCWRSAWERTSGLNDDEFRPNSDTFGVTIGPVRRCPVCDHRFVDVPDDFANGGVYEGVEGDDDPQAREGALLTYARRCQRLIAAHVGPRILEVGCWDAAHFQVFEDHGFTPTGVEPSEWAVTHAHATGRRVLLGTLDSPNVRASLDAQFDAVLLFDVIEHVTDPTALLSAAIRRTRPGGHVVLTTPRASAFLPRLLGSHWWSVMPMHVQFFSDESARLLVTRAPRVATSVFGLEPKAFPLSYYTARLQRLIHLPRRLVNPESKLGRHPVAPNLRDRLWVDLILTP